MVFLAISPKGLKDALRAAAASGDAVWCGSDAISSTDFADRNCKNLTRFSYALGTRSAEFLAGAIDTIDQHHPGEVIWVEGDLVNR